MSSPKAAMASPRSKPALKPAATSPALDGVDERLSADVARVAAEVERALLEGRIGVLTAEALQALMGAGCKLYAAQIEAGHDILPLGARDSVSATDVMTTTSGLLRAVNLAVFELGMWQSWTGR
jgi:hypothetical protein